ncbi:MULTISPECIES: spore germination protein [unclassified Paenibacillus]|uniref:spore germination protein n=1 Tax=unclassified Paenibacillus TaxID=185978 RepID=UPI001C116C26|nr:MULTISPECIES: spore germination protein [unclassified Paenibacillus]MBU5443218.1 spore germination protein [Paenibacillus sp. MSJ-34]CAH0121382.1 Spore germination protein B1 [Paenibacillus sp. CECT 9249]
MGFLQQQVPLSADCNENLRLLQSIYQDCSDVIYYQFLIAGRKRAILVYIDGITDNDAIDKQVILPLIREDGSDLSLANIRLHISHSAIAAVGTVAKASEEVNGGNALLIVDGEQQALSIGISKWEKRNIEEPTAEAVVRGPREGFVETLRVNTSMLRRKLKTSQLKLKSMNIGLYSNTKVVVAYIEDIVDPALVTEVVNRLERINVDGILESGYIEELIEDHPGSPFPQVLTTERPDVACANLLEGRIVILVDGTPISIIAPITFFSLLQSAEEYYQRYLISTAIRWLRYLFLAIALFGPSFYVAVVSFHQEMIPTKLLLTMAESREQVPFPALIEALLMEITFEALREAGIRLPKQVGAAVSIVGALVIGQAAISAGLVSTPMVMVVAITGIASFMIPQYALGTAMRLLRFPIMFLSGSLGLFGLLLGFILMLTHLLTLRSFGVPYLEPVAPLKFAGLKDVLVRSPFWMRNTRPHFTGKWNKFRQSPGQRPGPGRGGD